MNDDIKYTEVVDAVNKLAELFYPKLQVSTQLENASEEDIKNAPDTVQRYLKASSEIIEFNGIEFKRDILAYFQAIFLDDRIQNFCKLFQRYLWSYLDSDFERMNKIFSPEVYHLMLSTPFTYSIPERYDDV